MDVDRKTVAELGLSTVVMAVFVAAVFVASGRFAAPATPGANESVPPVLDPQGGLAVVAVIGLFVLLMAVMGVWMYRADFDEG
jgi:hypothetical protein